MNKSTRAGRVVSLAVQMAGEQEPREGPLWMVVQAVHCTGALGGGWGDLKDKPHPSALESLGLIRTDQRALLCNAGCAFSAVHSLRV